MLILGLFSLGIAVSISLWLFGRPWLLVWRTANLPYIWPWLKLMAIALQPFVSWRMRYKFNKLQSGSGLAEFWTVDTWLANKLLIALALAIFITVIAVLMSLQFKWLVLLAISTAVLGFKYPEQKLLMGVKKGRLQMQKQLPFMLDLLSLCVQSGLSLSSSLHKVAELAPEGPLRTSLRKSQALERTGLDRNAWLNHWAEQTDLKGVKNLVAALVQADKMGMNLAPILKAQSERQRSERFIQAENTALKAPVKMLLPMVVCIFPCTFLIIGFPIAIKIFEFAA